MTEREVAAELVYRMLRHGSEGNSFDPIVVTGAKTSMPHGVPGDKVIQAGDFVTMDFGCLKDGYCSDMTRTVAVGYATDEMKNVYDIVLKAQLAGIAAARAGVLGKEIDAAARKVIADAGYGEYFGHGFGHCLGLDIHEPPFAGPTGEAPLPAGSLSSAEPGIYLPGRFGVRIEDVMIIREDRRRGHHQGPEERADRSVKVWSLECRVCFLKDTGPLQRTNEIARSKLSRLIPTPNCKLCKKKLLHYARAYPVKYHR